MLRISDKSLQVKVRELQTPTEFIYKLSTLLEGLWGPRNTVFTLVPPSLAFGEECQGQRTLFSGSCEIIPPEDSQKKQALGI
jgi:hypothetical protein